MPHFAVPDMSCDACVRAITRAVQAADPAARVRVDLASQTVDIASDLPEAALARAVEDAGYSVTAAAA